MTEVINQAWGWTGVSAAEVFSINNFGQIIFRAANGAYWQIRPEELECNEIATDRQHLNELMATEAFMEAWEMYDEVEAARAMVGDLQKGEKYCLKLPTALGGLYDDANFGKIDLEKLIRFSGEMAYRIQDLSDDEKFKIILE